MSTPNSTSTLRPDALNASGLLGPSFDGYYLPILTVALLTISGGALYFGVFSTQGPYKVGGISTVKRPRLLDAYRSGVWWRIFLPRLVPYLEEGYYKYSRNDQPFRIWISGFQDYAYILPERHLERIKNLAASEVSFAAFVNKYFYVGLPTGEINNLAVQVVSKLLNGNLATVKALIQGETKKALAREIGSPTEWKRLNAWDIARKTAEAPGARVIFGQALADNERFVAAVAQYVSNIAAYGFALRYASMGPLKNIILYLLHWRHRRSLLAIVTPLNNVIAERKRVQSSQNLSEDKKPFDCVQWAMDQILPDEDKTGEAIARRLVLISTGTIETMAGIMAKQLVDLASHPECHEEIRAEIRESLVEENQGWTLKATAKMRKLESFIQESLRMTAGATPLTGLRVVTSSDFRLDDNIVLPKDTFIAFPTRSILYDAEIFPEPDKFDAFRFYKIKENKNAEPQPLQRDIRAGWLQFGYGRQACPGRFYAINVMKTILGEMILRYDIRLAGGDGTRPATMGIDFDPLLLPDRSIDLEFRVRS